MRKKFKTNVDKPEVFAPVADGFFTCPSCGERSRAIYSVCSDCGQAVRNTETPHQPQQEPEDETIESLMTAEKERKCPRCNWKEYLSELPDGYSRNTETTHQPQQVQRYEFAVRIGKALVGTGKAAKPYLGVCVLTSRDGILHLTPRSGTPLSIPWQDTREVNDRIEKSGTVTLDLGRKRDDMVMAISFSQPDRQSAARMLAQVPAEAFMKKCPTCAGYVDQGVCKLCGKSRSATIRKQGLTRVVIGVVALFVGCALTALSSSGNAGGGAVVFVGLIFWAIYTFVRGVINLIAGARS